MASSCFARRAMRRFSRGLAAADSVSACATARRACSESSSPEYTNDRPTQAMASFGSARSAWWKDRAASTQT